MSKDSKLLQNITESSQNTNILKGLGENKQEENCPQIAQIRTLVYSLSYLPFYSPILSRPIVDQIYAIFKGS